MKPAPTWVPTSAAQMAAEAAEPPPPPVSKAGTLTKLSFTKGMLGSERWQKRHFVLKESGMEYFKKEGDPTPRNVVPFMPGGFVQATKKGEQRRKDAFNFKDSAPGMGKMLTANIGELASPYDGTVSRDFVLAIHKPTDVSNMLGSVMGQSALGLAFGGGMKKVEEQRSRTWYIACENESEQQEWLNAIAHNLKLSISGGAGAQKAVESFCKTIAQVGGSTAGVDLVPLLNQLYS